MFQTRYIKYGTLSGLILLCTIILGTTEDSQRLVFAQITPAPAPEDSGSHASNTDGSNSNDDSSGSASGSNDDNNDSDGTSKFRRFIIIE